jgi:DNA gyrase subunit A
MVTSQGTIKKTPIKDFENIRRTGLIAIKIKENDKLLWIRPVTEKDEIMLTTAKGQAIRFKSSDARGMGRAASGVRGIRLKSSDTIVGMNIINTEDLKAKIKSLVVTSRGFGKMTDISQYRLQTRGGSGIRTAKVTPKNGDVVWTTALNPSKLPDDISGDLMIISHKGQVIRLPLKSVPNTGRDTQGVRLMRFKATDDYVASVTLI